MSAGARLVASPVGMLRIAAADGAIVALDWVEDGSSGPASPRVEAGTAEDALLAEAARQLDAYFSGDLEDFDLPLAPEGSDHDKAVWRAMCAIPYGEVRTYGAIAGEIASVARAVGTACGRNPIPVIVPCHRVVAAGGRPGGYSGRGGLATKRALLALEGVQPGRQPDLFDAVDSEAGDSETGDSAAGRY